MGESGGLLHVSVAGLVWVQAARPGPLVRLGSGPPVVARQERHGAVAASRPAKFAGRGVVSPSGSEYGPVRASLLPRAAVISSAAAAHQRRAALPR